MKKAFDCFCERSTFVFLVLLSCICTANKSFAQCSTASGPSYSNSCTSDYYTSVTASGTGVVSTIGVTGSSCTGTYFNYFASQGVAVGPASTINMNMTRYATYNAYLTVYVDWNNDGIYQSTELAGTAIYMPVSVLSTVYSFTIPSSGVVTGTNLHMRMMLSELAGGAPCSANWGETCDFYINVTCAIPVISVSPSASAICSGGSGSVLTASGAGVGGTYSWSPATGLSATTGAVVTATPGSGVAVYSVTGTSSSGCSDTASATVTVTPMPGPITGIDSVCAGSNISLSDTVAGGVWSSSNPAQATIDPATGIVYSLSPGNTVISYTIGASCTVTTSFKVNIAPSPISGATSVCSGQTSALSNSINGGIWSSDNMLVATISGIGVVSGVSSGTANISYTIASCSTGAAISVNTILPITGGEGVCVGSTIALSDPTPGGVWSSGGMSAATVSATGVVTGVASGSASIYYMVGACYVSVLVPVGFPLASITAADTIVCTGSTITLNDATAGGIWSSNNTLVAAISGNGVVSGVIAGTAVMSYASTGCSTNKTVTVETAGAGTITGKDSVCIGPAHQITLSDDINGGVWSSVTVSRATVDPVTGVVTGVTTGIDTIKYTVTNFCGTFTAKFLLHIRTQAQCATGVRGITEEQAVGLKVFPNPNMGIFTMNLMSDIDEEVHVVITNIVGTKIREFITTTNKSADIKLDAAPGIYLLSASTAHGRYVAKVVVD